MRKAKPPRRAKIDHTRWSIVVEWTDGSAEHRVYHTKAEFEAAYIELVGHPPRALEEWTR